jgi:hypothetical protein
MGEAEVIAEQKKKTYTPYIRLLMELTGQTTYTYTTLDTPNRILHVDQVQEPYAEKVNIVLSNADKALTGFNLAGYKITIGFGFVIAAAGDYIDQAPVWIYDSEFDSRPGHLTLTLRCKGIMSRMANDRASEDYIPAEDVDPSTIVEGIFESGLAPYTNCQSYLVSWGTLTLATDIDFYNPGGGYKIYKNTTRLVAVRKLLDNSYAFPQWDSVTDGIKFIRPVITGTTYDYAYELDGDHTFFIKKDIKAKVIPEGVTVYGGAFDDDTQQYEYEGTAGGTNKYFVHFEAITSDGICGDLAAAIFANATIGTKICDAVVPMNCTARLFDYCKITDAREGSTKVGNIGMIRRIYEAGTYRMQVKFGGWQSARNLEDILSGTRRNQTETTRKWMTVNIPEIPLAAGESAVIQQFNLGSAKTMVIEAYSVYAGGYPDIALKVQGGGDFVATGEDNPTLVKLQQEVLFYANGTGSNVEVTITVENIGVTGIYASGFLTFAIY